MDSHREAATDLMATWVCLHLWSEMGTASVVLLLFPFRFIPEPTTPRSRHRRLYPMQVQYIWSVGCQCSTLIEIYLESANCGGRGPTRTRWHVRKVGSNNVSISGVKRISVGSVQVARPIQVRCRIKIVIAKVIGIICGKKIKIWEIWNYPRDGLTLGFGKPSSVVA